jgi:hypothetical protein
MSKENIRMYRAKDHPTIPEDHNEMGVPPPRTASQTGFKDEAHPKAIVSEAQEIVNNALESSALDCGQAQGRR